MNSKLEKLKELRSQINYVVNGYNNYPSNSTVMIFSNHCCLMDIFYVPMVINDDIVSIISARLMYKNNNEERKKFVYDYLNPIPVEAHGGRYYSDVCINNASLVLESKMSCHIFPEGVYYPEKNVVCKGRVGGAQILFNSLSVNKNIMLVPISLKYKEKITDLDALKQDNNLEINILEPIDFSLDYERYMNCDNYDDKKIFLHNVTDNAMRSIAKSLNQTYESEYFPLDKKDMIFMDGTLINSYTSSSNYVKSIYKKNLESYTKKLCLDLKKERSA